MPDKPLNEYEFFKDIIERKKNSGCSACRQEGFMLEAQVMDMMRERMEKNGVSNKDAAGIGRKDAGFSDKSGTEERDPRPSDPVSK